MARPVAEFTSTGREACPPRRLPQQQRRAGLRSSPAGPADGRGGVTRSPTAGFRDAAHLRDVASNPSDRHPCRTGDARDRRSTRPSRRRSSRTNGRAPPSGPTSRWPSAGSARWATSGDEGQPDRGAQPARPERARRERPGRVPPGWVAPTETHPFLGFMQGAQTSSRTRCIRSGRVACPERDVGALYNNFLHGTGLDDYMPTPRIMRHGRVADPARYAMTHRHDPRAGGPHARTRGPMPTRRSSRGSTRSRSMWGAGPGRRAACGGPAWRAAACPPRARRPPSRRSGTCSGRPARGTRSGKPASAGAPVDRLLRGANAGVRHEDTFAPLVLGRQVGTGIEDYVRLANYLGNLRRAWRRTSPGRPGRSTSTTRT
jgi:hypothetical protein